MSKRFIYLVYYLKHLDLKIFYKFLDFSSSTSKKSKTLLVIDCLKSVFKYNVSILEYFQFHFYNKTHLERKKWAGTGFMYEAILKLNPRSSRSLLSDKVKFASHYATFLKHKSYNIEEWLDMAKKRGKIGGMWVLKPIDGQCGLGILKVNASKKSIAEIKKIAKVTKNGIIEPYLDQHKALQKLSPSGLNTLRIITQINHHRGVDILGIRLRITINSFIDNLAAGNMAVPVDNDTGEVVGRGVYSDMTKEPATYHPVTGEKLIGFQVPYFKEAVELAKNAALFDTRNTSIGWDIAILKDGPDIIEGNHNWCKLLWQLPVQKGLKKELNKYLSFV